MPPCVALNRSLYRSTFLIMASRYTGCPSRIFHVSGFWQYWQRRGHPDMKTVMRVPGPSTDVLMSHEWTKPMSPLLSAWMRSRLSRPMGDSKPESPPIRVCEAYSFDALSICGRVVRNCAISDIIVLLESTSCIPYYKRFARRPPAMDFMSCEDRHADSQARRPAQPYEKGTKPVGLAPFIVWSSPSVSR